MRKQLFNVSGPDFRPSPPLKQTAAGLSVLVGFTLALIPAPMEAQATQFTMTYTGCGGEGEAPCPQTGPYDQVVTYKQLPANTPPNSILNGNDTLRCDYGLQIGFNSSANLICVNNTRQTLADYDSRVFTPFLSFALRNQDGSIQADQPIAFAPVFGTHNSYSNYADAANTNISLSQFSVDQGYSITDQLQYGARYLRLDPWYFNTTDNQIKTCHSSNLGDISGLAVCNGFAQLDAVVGTPSLNRLFVQEIKELHHWLSNHPGEVVILYLNGDGGQFGTVDITENAATDTTYLNSVSPAGFYSIPGSEYYWSVVQAELGSLVYQNASAGVVPGSYRFPTMRQLRAMGKQVVIFSGYPSQWAFEDNNSYPRSVFGNILRTPGTYDYSTCEDSSGKQVIIGNHASYEFASTGEDRSLSANVGGSPTATMMDAPRMQASLNCGFTLIDLDFLGTLSQAPNPSSALVYALNLVLGLNGAPGINSADNQCDDFGASAGCPTKDTRRENFIWSWNPLSPQGGNMGTQMVTNRTPGAFGSWWAVNPAANAPYLCAALSFSGGKLDSTNPDNIAWSLTANEGPFSGGEAECQSEFGGTVHFWRPQSPVQNNNAWAAIGGKAPGAWINHFTAPGVSVQPGKLTFTGVPSSLPSQMVIYSGGYGGALTATSTDPTVTITPVQMVQDSSWNSSDNADTNIFVVSVANTSQLIAGTPYHTSVTITEANTPAGDLTATVPITINPRASVSITVSANAYYSPQNVFTVDGKQYTGSETFQWTSGDVHVLDASATVAGPDVMQTFTSWSTGSRSAVINYTVPNTGATVTANFTTYYYLDISSTGSGTVTTSQTSSNGYFLAGQNLTLTAVPARGYFLNDWYGTYNSTSNPFTIQVVAPGYNVTADFRTLGEVDVASNPVGLNVVADGSAYQIPHIFQWQPGSIHTLSVPTPQVSQLQGIQYVFSQWENGSTVNSRSVTAPATTSDLKANFTTQYDLAATVSPAGAGTVSGTGWYNSGATANITATAAGGYVFTGITGDVKSSTAAASVAMNGPKSVVVNFAPAAPQIRFNGTVVNDSSPNAVVLALTATNSGQGTAASLQITSIAASVVSGAGTVTVPAGAPFAFSTLGEGANFTGPQMSFTWPTSATRVELTVRFSANNGAYTGTQSFYLFR